ncbi:MAG: hypothetical protein IT371_29135 [Deltaproteobacteria bacterium]|nr:hypothetical protein [Deltaproteobacteria bacterium]
MPSVVTPSGLRLSVLRWLIPFMLPLGFLLSEDALGHLTTDYAMWTIVGTLAVAVTFWRIGLDWLRALPLIALLSLFLVGYYLQFYWSIFTPDSLEDIYWELPFVVTESAVLAEAYEVINLGMLGLAAGTLLMLTLPAPQHSLIPTDPRQLSTDDRSAFRKASTILLVISPVLMLTSGVIMYAFNIAVSGARGVYLPFRMSGFVYYTHSMIVPALLALLIWCSDMAGLKRRMTLGIAMVVAQGILGMLLRSSRGVLFVLAILLFLVLLTSGRLNWRRMTPMIVFGLLMGLFWPLFTMYRTLRVIDPAITPLSALSESVASLFGGSESLTTAYSSGMESTLRRMGNVYSVILLAWKQVTPVGLKAVTVGGLDVGRYFTVSILGYPADSPHSSATSLVGWFYVVGGKSLVFFGMAFFACYVDLIWRALRSLRLRTLPVAQATLIFWLAHIVLEGALDRIGLAMLVLTASIAAPEILLRSTVPRRRLPLFFRKPRRREAPAVAPPSPP